MPDAQVSVIIPVFNAERFLAEALESVWTQHYRALEVLVIDDGSTDGSAALLSGLRHPQLHLLSHRQNRGPGAARNAALTMARGDLITFLDADDLMTPGRLAFQVGYLAEHRDVDVVVGTEVIRILPGVEPPAWLGLPRRPGSRYYQMSMMARRSAFERAGPFDESFRLGSDNEWSCRAGAVGVRTALVDQVLVERRLHGANLTYRTAEMRRGMERAFLKAARDRLRHRSSRS